MSFSDGTLPAFDSHHNNAAQGYSPQRIGCTFDGCSTQDTATVDGYTGRRCAQHPPQPPWLTLADLGRFRDAFQALRSHLTARARGWL